MKRGSLPLLVASIAFAETRPPAAYIPIFEKTLRENILAFWYPRTIDTKHGGYAINHDAKGSFKGDAPKGIVTQARQVWLFSRCAREGYGDKKAMLDAARHGYDFLRAKLWDAKNGGFYWSVDATGNEKRQPKKHLYGQAFGLYAISEYARASGRVDALNLANDIFAVLEKHAHDKREGGYREFFNEDWSPASPTEPSYMSGGAAVKLMNTHLHLMEAMTTYYLASKSPIARDRLIELVDIETNAVVRKGLVACTDQFERDWTPKLEGKLATISYGHDIENVWLIAEARHALGMPVAPFVDLFKDLWSYSLKYGFDHEKGGFFYTGPFNAPAVDRQKSWWVQAEALVSALEMYKLTGDDKYYDVFEKTWDFLDKHQIDWQNGEWHSTVLPDGTTRGEKAQIWKAGYHNGRAMIDSIIRLRQLDTLR
jgi:mannose/cellobiose epimerase-like protein (N-acyl-D-glucosamine 2-epimerase family)